MIPINAVAKYRGCTRKSILGFGNYADLPVGEILKVDKIYVAWVYYNIEKVTFSEDILQELGIVERIDKPGVDRKAFYRWKDALYADIPEDKKDLAYLAKWRGRKKAACANMRRVEKATSYSKAALQANNHGHIKLNH